jgi:predicted signal transduction protein with EAL and GGDEF domain
LADVVGAIRARKEPGCGPQATSTVRLFGEEAKVNDFIWTRDLEGRFNTASRHVVQAVVALAQAFSLQTVGEGVEDAETLTLLRELGVDYAQGYHIARPGPFDF